MSKRKKGRKAQQFLGRGSAEGSGANSLFNRRANSNFEWDRDLCERASYLIGILYSISISRDDSTNVLHALSPDWTLLLLLCEEFLVDASTRVRLELRKVSDLMALSRHTYWQDSRNRRFDWNAETCKDALLLIIVLKELCTSMNTRTEEVEGSEAVTDWAALSTVTKLFIEATGGVLEREIPFRRFPDSGGDLTASDWF